MTMFSGSRTASFALGMFSLAMLANSGVGRANEISYTIDPDHTYPSFEADHLAGLSTWRGKFNKTSGKVTLDKAAGTGSLDIAVDAASIDFGQDQLNTWALGKDLLETSKYPQAVFKGRLEGFVHGAPTRAVGNLTLHGVSKPLVLNIDSFKCMPHPMLKREVCGADALATIKRDDFGMAAGKDYGFKMDVVLRIQVEALQDVAAAPSSPKAP
jgi:polyisoprenoid-binding protein YceI